MIMSVIISMISERDSRSRRSFPCQALPHLLLLTLVSSSMVSGLQSSASQHLQPQPAMNMQNVRCFDFSNHPLIRSGAGLPSVPTKQSIAQSLFPEFPDHLDDASLFGLVNEMQDRVQDPGTKSLHNHHHSHPPPPTPHHPASQSSASPSLQHQDVRLVFEPVFFPSSPASSSSSSYATNSGAAGDDGGGGGVGLHHLLHGVSAAPDAASSSIRNSLQQELMMQRGTDARGDASYESSSHPPPPQTPPPPAISTPASSSLGDGNQRPESRLNSGQQHTTTTTGGSGSPFMRPAAVSSIGGRCSCHCEPVMQPMMKPEVPRVQVKYVPVVVSTSTGQANLVPTNRPIGDRDTEAGRETSRPHHHPLPANTGRNRGTPAAGHHPDFDDRSVGDDEEEDERHHRLPHHRHRHHPASGESPHYESGVSRSDSGMTGMSNGAAEEDKIPLILSQGGGRYSSQSGSSSSFFDSEQDSRRSENQNQEPRQQQGSRTDRQEEQDESPGILSHGNRLKEGHRSRDEDLDGEMGDSSTSRAIGSSRGSLGPAGSPVTGRSVGRGMGGDSFSQQSLSPRQQQELREAQRHSSSRNRMTDREKDASWKPKSQQQQPGSERGVRGGENSLSATLERLANKQFIIESSDMDGFPFSSVPTPFHVNYLL